ncbi:zinc ribbon domain-containing protein [Novosphingobium sp. SG751A]|uniref:FmdB family zinc ribbon protein n=1 Tax=Novosphingobium sp. SG751A TaxID=2587000 RepID=UPI0015567483|nr:zinc ribbon domain-containing protein [Novosphingobium sp. SG751A]
MPLYDIECEACMAVSEVLVKASDPVICPACGSERAHRLVSRPAAPGTSRAIMAAGREVARREGHLSNF